MKNIEHQWSNITTERRAYTEQNHPFTSILSPHLVATKCLKHLKTCSPWYGASAWALATHSAISATARQLHNPIQSVSHPSRPVPMSTVFDSLQYSRQDQRTRSLVDPSNVLQAMSPWATYRETGQGIGGQSLSVVWSHVNGYAIGNVRSCKIFIDFPEPSESPSKATMKLGSFWCSVRCPWPVKNTRLHSWLKWS